ncbi:hypothetical protein LCGC14_0888520 [marine sediment metagenome]|uniref:Uncharacterized protein n=1 Tax=marine sediment metagenome TaxID=412755 RepID=A0A0F9P4R6_9ZZZZ
MNVLDELKKLTNKVKERRKIDTKAVEQSQEYIRRIKQAAKTR